MMQHETQTHQSVPTAAAAAAPDRSEAEGDQASERVWTTEELGRRWRLNPATIRWHIRQGNLAATRISRHYRVRQSEWDAFLAKYNPVRRA